MSAKHRRDDDESTPRKKLYSLLDQRGAEVVLWGCVVVIMIPFGCIAVAVAVVMILLAWLL